MKERVEILIEKADNLIYSDYCRLLHVLNWSL